MFKQAQLSYNIKEMIFVRMGKNIVYHGECHEAYYHHLKQLEEVIARETPWRRFRKSRLSCALILHGEPVCTQKEEDGHAIMTEKGDEMNRKQAVGMQQGTVEPVYIHAEELVFVFFHRRAEPMAIVMKEYTDNGQAP